jgi:hypothetical protein
MEGLIKELEYCKSLSEPKLKEYLTWSGAIRHYPQFSKAIVIAKLESVLAEYN